MRDPASFRDPSGHVYDIGGRILRTVTSGAVPDYEFVRDTGVLGDLVNRGWVIAAEELDGAALESVFDGSHYVLEHPRLPFISYPYEWPFEGLKAAALLHLDLQTALLSKGVVLSDANAYNIQFRGTDPVFIDYLSFQRYEDGAFWTGHKQFCEHFLNPLLLRAYLGVSHAHWFRGSGEGIATGDLNQLLPLRRKLSWRTFIHVVLPARLQQRALLGQDEESAKRINVGRLPKAAYERMLMQLRKWINTLKPLDRGRTVWSDYTDTNKYSDEEEKRKKSLITEFVEACRPKLVWDLGCNAGEYSETALRAGAEYVIGFDFDQRALDLAFVRGRKRGLNFLPLFMDAANPSPDQGWNEQERRGLGGRRSANALLALAFEHHLAIARNVPLPEVVGWLVDQAPRGLIEFVQKDDPMVHKMLSIREDIFQDYDEKRFRLALKRKARIIRADTVSASNRRLYWYERD